jgi:hypothetical protein
MQRLASLALVAGLFGHAIPASAALLGTDFLFECGQCTPAVADHFIGKAGPSDFQLKFDDYVWYEVDVEAASISFKALVEGSIRSPLVFRLTWSPAQYHLAQATISPTSTFETGFSWGPGELLVDLGGMYLLQGDQITFDVAAAPVPEPASWLLAMLGAAALLCRRRRLDRT